MKRIKQCLAVPFVAIAFGLSQSAWAGGPCEPASANSIGVPSFAQDGDLINYTYTCSIPVAPIPCDATLTEATFFKPDNPPNDVNQCDATNGLALPAPAVTLAPGEFIRFSAVDNPAIPNCGAGDVDCEIVDPNLQYIADHADEVAGELTAFGCCKFVALPGGEDTQAQAEDDTTVLHPNITIDKSAEPTSVCEGFETEVTYSYEVEWDLERDPPADTDVVDVMVTDDTCAPVVRGPDNPGNNNDTLELGELFTFSCTTTVSTETTNTATATAVEPNLERGVEASDDFTVTAEICDVSIDKICDANQTQFINEISIEVCNDGTVQLENCMVSDEYFPGDPECPGNGGPGTGVALDCPAELSTLDPGECQTCTGTIDPCVEMDTANNAEVTCEVVGTDDTVQDDDCDVCEPCCIPDISIVKTAGDAPDGEVLVIDPGDAVVFDYFVCNTGTCDLINVEVTDDNATPDTGDDFSITIGFLAAGDCVTVSSDPIIIDDPPICDATRLNTACVEGEAPDGAIVNDCDDAELCTPPPGGEGCTPGYWKLIDSDPAKASHQCNYADPYTPGTLFCNVFDCSGNNAFNGMTLIQVLEQGGGGHKALGRHTVAALLNAAAGNVAYPISEQDVIDMFNDTWPCKGNECNALKSIFATENEENCCPLAVCKCADSGEHCNVSEPSNGAVLCDKGDGVCQDVDNGGECEEPDNVAISVQPAPSDDRDSVQEDKADALKVGDADSTESPETGTFAPSAGCGVFGLFGLLLLFVGLVGLRLRRKS